jgi:hypothetical protein
MAASPSAPAVASPYAKTPQALSLDTSLVESLRFAVPLWIHEVRNLPAEHRVARAVRCADVVGAKGDALQFNALAEGLAYAAYLPGGVTFAGLHWCVVEQVTSGPCDAEVDRAWDEATAPPRDRRPIVDVELPDPDAQGGVECV